MNWSSYTNNILQQLDNEAFFLNALEQVNKRGHEVKASCPFAHLHSGGEDKTPSFTVNLLKGLYYCNTCHSKGNAHTLYKYIHRLSSDEAWFQLGDRLNIARPDKLTRPNIDVGLISDYHQKLLESTGPVRDMLRLKRGLTDETIKRFILGWDGERVTIPIYDEFNTLVNIRRYQWNSTEDKWKVLNYTDEKGNTYGELRIFGIESLIENDSVIWCEGEMDRIIAEQNGFPTCCATSGAGTLKLEWLRLFKRKVVYIMQDNDEAGKRATEELCKKLSPVCDPRVVKWPTGFKEKGDITDFLLEYTKEEFQELLDNAQPYKPVENTEEVHDVSLAESSNAEFAGKRVKIPVMVSGKDTAPYLCPKNVVATCAVFDGNEKKCMYCALLDCTGKVEMNVMEDKKNVLKLIKCTDTFQEGALREILGINAKCHSASIKVENYDNIEELRLIPKADMNFSFDKRDEYVVRNGFYIGKDVQANKRYTLTGNVIPDPKSQFASYLFDELTHEKDIISSFCMTNELYEQLKAFQPTGSIKEKLSEIYADIERNVSYIWERRDVYTAVDLVFHTPMHFNFQEQLVKKGWGELLIIGDSGQAKTTLVERIMAHYRLGDVHSGESSRRTGLIYSSQQNGNRWFLVWGALPLNDGGLVAIDELSGLPKEVIETMSDVRSSGIAKVTGVITAETTSRTRLILISNPRNGKQLNSAAHGVEHILSLIGKAEDVRRLDLAITVASGDVTAEVVNTSLSDMPKVEHRYTSDLCNSRALWAWSRSPEDIFITPEATKTILDNAIKMGKKYSPTIPLVEAADHRLKIARLSIGCAAMMFSTNTGEDLIVKPEHVEFVCDFMDECYSKKSMSYDKFSEIKSESTDASSGKLEALRKMFLRLPSNDHNELSAILYSIPYFNRLTLEDYTGLPKEELKSLLKFLTTNNLIEKYKNDYRRQPLGTALFEHLTKHEITNEEIALARKGHYTTDF